MASVKLPWERLWEILWQEIGSAQTRNPEAVTNHLQFWLAATTITWNYAEHLP